MKQRKIILSVTICLAILTRLQAQVFIQGGAQIDFTGSTFISIENGDFINNGIFNAGTNSTVIFTGSNTDAHIGGNQVSRFIDLKIDKPNRTVFLDQDIAIHFDIIFSEGFLDLNGHNIDLGSLAVLANEVENSRVIGPAGGEIISTVNLNAPVNTNPSGLGLFITSTENLGLTTVRRGHVPVTSGNSTSIQRYYTIMPNNNTGLDATLHFRYFDAELNNIPEAELELWHNTGADWEPLGFSARSDAQNFVEQSGIDHFTTWTLTNQANALPVEWLSFQAFLQDDNRVLLEWKTAHKQNNAGFEIERRMPVGTGWSKLGFVPAATGDYRFLDDKPLPGLNFYRLKQQDKDGTFSFSPIVSVHVLETVTPLYVYPNPALDEINIQLPDDAMSITLYDNLGRLLLTQTVYGESLIRLNINQLQSGAYWLLVHKNDGFEQVKWLK